MKISTRGRYALRIMLDIALTGGDSPVSFKDISNRQDISFKYMEQIGALLTRSGLLRSVRGAQGGYLLVRSPAETTIGMVLRVTEGQLSPVECLASGENTCPRSADCITIPLWERLNDAILNVIDTMTLQDLIDISKERHIITIDGEPAGAGALKCRRLTRLERRRARDMSRPLCEIDPCPTRCAGLGTDMMITLIYLPYISTVRFTF